MYLHNSVSISDNIFLQIEAGQYCSFLIFSDGSMKACGKVRRMPILEHLSSCVWYHLEVLCANYTNMYKRGICAVLINVDMYIVQVKFL